LPHSPDVVLGPMSAITNALLISPNAVAE